MADTYLRQTALAHLHLDARAANEPEDITTGVQIGERPLLGMINLRVRNLNSTLRSAVKKLSARLYPALMKPSGNQMGSTS